MDESEREAWMKRGEYLPKPLRDFHDQKDLFKTIHEMVENSREKRDGIDYTDGISWVAAQVYSIDFFLWFMARHGYTLQRSRKRVKFQDLDKTVSTCRERQMREMAGILGLTPLASDKTTPQSYTG